LKIKAGMGKYCIYCFENVDKTGIEKYIIIDFDILRKTCLYKLNIQNENTDHSQLCYYNYDMLSYYGVIIKHKGFDEEIFKGYSE
jgi:hypothetical protein